MQKGCKVHEKRRCRKLGAEMKEWVWCRHAGANERESNVDVRDRGSVGIWTEVFTGCKNFLWSASLMSLSDVNVLHCRRLQSLLTVTNRQISIIYVPVKRLRPPQITRKKKAPSLSVHTWRNASPVGMRQHIISLPLPVRLTRLTYL